MAAAHESKCLFPCKPGARTPVEELYGLRLPVLFWLSLLRLERDAMLHEPEGRLLLRSKREQHLHHDRRR